MARAVDRGRGDHGPAAQNLDQTADFARRPGDTQGLVIGESARRQRAAIGVEAGDGDGRGRGLVHGDRGLG